MVATGKNRILRFLEKKNTLDYFQGVLNDLSITNSENRADFLLPTANLC